MKRLAVPLSVILFVLLLSGLFSTYHIDAATPVPVSGMTPVATVTPGSLLYLVQSPASTPVSRQANVEAVVHAGIEPIGVTSTTVTIGANTIITGTTAISGTSTLVGNTTLNGTLTLESVAFSGPLVFGIQAGCTEGTQIAHGLAITPSVVLITPASAITATAYVSETDDTNITIGFVGGSGSAVLYWMAGK